MIQREQRVIGALATRMSQLSRRAKRLVMIAADVLMVPIALWCAIALQERTLISLISLNWKLYVLAVLLCVPIFARYGLYRAVVRFMGTKVVIAVGYGVLTASLALGLISQFLMTSPVPVTTLLVFSMLCLIYVGGSRFLVRAYLQRQLKSGGRVAIYGAGAAGAQLASSLAGGQEFVPVAFLDDNFSLTGSVINGIEVFPPSQLSSLVEHLGVTRVLMAVPSISRRRRLSIIESLEKHPVHVQTMPNFSDLISGDARFDDIREVDVADLLGRDTVPPNDSLMDACIRGKVVMVTGAGGSIGSELCRQIIRQGPTRFLLLETNELALYSINQELNLIVERDKLDVEVVPLLGSAQHKRRVTQVMTSFNVQTVYHAAAYKHVPMVEENIVEGMNNNVFGTLHCAEAAIASGVEKFVLVSTDKAVCPTNVMGATKRLAEMVLQGLHERGSETRFCMVRFGNVLASSGSVVPLFREQIRRGGPVTVTHKEIIRYFMTIPEAAQLVIQAGSMGTGGDVFLLDMGEPVRIGDLARRMIHLMGLTVLDDENPEGDIEIRYTGLRAAEKLYEELLIGNNVMGTEHRMIMRAEEKRLPWTEIRKVIDQLLVAAEAFDSESTLEILSRAVDEYTPANEIVDLVWVEQRSKARAISKAQVTPLVVKTRS